MFLNILLQAKYALYSQHYIKFKISYRNYSSVHTENNPNFPIEIFKLVYQIPKFTEMYVAKLLEGHWSVVATCLLCCKFKPRWLNLINNQACYFFPLFPSFFFMFLKLGEDWSGYNEQSYKCYLHVNFLISRKLIPKLFCTNLQILRT